MTSFAVEDPPNASGTKDRLGAETCGGIRYADFDRMIEASKLIDTHDLVVVDKYAS